MHETATERKRVLVIEDEPDFATLLKYRLQQKGYEAILAFDGLSGLEEASHCRPDLIVLDLMLPRMAGLEVCRILRSNSAMKHVPIWIMTALDSISHKASAYRMGAGGYYNKSNQLPDLFIPQSILVLGFNERLMKAVCFRPIFFHTVDLLNH